MTEFDGAGPQSASRPDHARLAETVAGGPLTSEGPGSVHRYRSLVLGAVGVLLLAMAMLMGYSGAFSQPQLNNVELAVAGDASSIVALEQQAAFELTIVASDADAQQLVRDREVDGAVVLPAAGQGGTVTTYIASGSGRSQALAIAAAGTTIAQNLGATDTTTDLAPLPEKDPGGTLEFYAVLFVTLGASLGSTLFGRILGTVDTATRFVERSIVLVAYSAALAGLVTLWIAKGLEGVTVDPWAVMATLTLTALAVGGAVTGVAAVGGTIAALAVTVLLVVLGNPSTGGPLGIHLLNDFYQSLYYVFPQGDGLEIIRSIQYFDGAAVAGPVARLAVWATCGILLTLAAMLLRSRREAKASRSHRSTPAAQHFAQIDPQVARATPQAALAGPAARHGGAGDVLTEPVAG
ncbi:MULTISPECIES: hypothetical protein [unclassified Rathayibacter]|uniref:hypothetical protein n=1 Tax=unclassified Rathayibacter TaxID=2609250 RepID=UPI0006FB87A6|nr:MULTISPECIES: hypothetical protein [unclassified Rathayibacter]KQQ03383.1 hypothetical protein ASF42_07600 [Rathayibacter sp. Leaf294]KQS11838.1 hypothetical protein ASG06_07600 [Rathayibacter sp. Leaf185]